eukprot:Lithocolla_globosa_v1_NODE_994_length_2971_cov_9.882030.p1 type:complete len:392 gc:universal NODE_994_length_2971_cov_9.882030:479-1654(+)
MVKRKVSHPNPRGKTQSKMSSRSCSQRAVLIGLMFLLSIVPNLAFDKPASAKFDVLAPPSHDYDCVFCHRNVRAQKLWAGTRTLNTEDLNETNKKNAQDWCDKNNHSLADLDGRYMCGRDRLRMSNGTLKDLALANKTTTQPVLQPTTPTRETDHAKKQQTSPKQPISLDDDDKGPECACTAGCHTGVRFEDMKKVPNSGKKCVVCNTTVVAGCVKIPYLAQMELLLDFQLLLPDNSNCRICSSHLDGEHLHKDVEITRNYGQFGCILSEENAQKLVNDLINLTKKFRKMNYLNFEVDGALSDDDYQLWTGWTKEQFDEMAKQLNGVNKSHIRTKREALAMFWIKLKTDLSYSQISSLFKIHNPKSDGRIIVSRSVESVADSMDKVFFCFF